MKFKGLHFADVAVIQEAVTDELKTVRKVEFSAAFQKLYNRAKAYVCVCIYANGAYFELKKKVCLPHVSSIFKKMRPKPFGPHRVFTSIMVKMEIIVLSGVPRKCKCHNDRSGC